MTKKLLLSLLLFPAAAATQSGHPKQLPDASPVVSVANEWAPYSAPLSPANRASTLRRCVAELTIFLAIFGVAWVISLPFIFTSISKALAEAIKNGIVDESDRDAVTNFLSQYGKEYGGNVISVLYLLLRCGLVYMQADYRLFGMQVVDAKGEKIEGWEAVLRFLIKQFFLYPFTWVGFFIGDGRPLHDRIFDTYVVRV